MMKIFLTALFVLFASTSVYCEPNKTARILANTPLSMLDWGMYRTADFYQKNRIPLTQDINKKFKRKRFSEGRGDYSPPNSKQEKIYLDTGCYYDRDINRIIVLVNILKLKRNLLADKQFLKRLCKHTTERFKNSNIQSFFIPDGMSRKGYPTEDAIEKLIRLKVVVKSESFQDILSSDSDWNSDKIMYSE